MRGGNKVNLVRYADDFVITGRTKELLEKQVLPLVSSFMAERGLELSPEKTVITHIEDGFDFLGQNVRKRHGRLLITPSRKNVQTFLDGIREIIRGNKQTTAGKLIEQLNPKIRGWAKYHRHVYSAATFQQVDHAIFEALWRWALRRHPDKSRRWVKDRYYTYLPRPLGGDHWWFFGMVERGQNDERTIVLRRACQTHIRRHTKVRSDVNPYTTCWHQYLSERHTRGNRYRVTTLATGDVDQNPSESIISVPAP